MATLTLTGSRHADNTPGPDARVRRHPVGAFRFPCLWRRQAEAVGETATRARLRRLARQGRALGLVSVQDGLRFVNVAFALGDDFLVRYPWAARIAGNGHLSPAVRLELLVDRTAAWLDGEEVT
jgi:hypothetical protein